MNYREKREQEKKEKEISINEIKQKLSFMGDFLKMEFLEEVLRKISDFETKKFIHLRLAELYENGKMFKEAAKHIVACSDISVTFKDKLNLLAKATRLLIKSKDYKLVDQITKKAFSIGTETENKDFKILIKDLYIRQAKFYETTGKRNYALKCYEKIFSLDLNQKEKKEIKQKLIELYERLGKIKEYFALKGNT